MNDVKPRILQYLSLGDLEKMDQNDPQVLTEMVKRWKEQKRITIRYPITPLEELYSDVEYDFDDSIKMLLFDPMEYYRANMSQEEKQRILTGIRNNEVDDTPNQCITRRFISRGMPRRDMVWGCHLGPKGLRKIGKNHYRVTMYP